MAVKHGKKKVAKRKHNTKNQCWDHLEECRRSIVDTISASAMVGKIVHNKPLMEQIDDMPKFSKNMQLLSKDLHEINQEVQEIAKEHDGKKGGGNAMANLEAISIFEKYNDAQTKYHTVVLPTLIDLEVAINKAASKLSEEPVETTNP